MNDSDFLQKAFLILSDGTIFEGKSFGEQGRVIGEAVFTTGMNGYLETLTDPSYFGQVVVQTFPLIGNYGVINDDVESTKSFVKGYVVRSVCDFPSNFRSKANLDSYLKEQKIVGICEIDTRKLTKILRESGVMNAMIVSGAELLKIDSSLKSDEQKKSLLDEIKAYKIENAVKNVSRASQKIEEDAKIVFEKSAEYGSVPIRADGTKIKDFFDAQKAGVGKKIALWDFGAKANIRRELLKRGANVELFSWDSSAKQILESKPDAIMLSNGPGDPSENTKIIEELQILIKSSIPIFGICLGHQLLALANGAKTKKLKYGHRGANQPVKDLQTGRVYITSQNHGYAVENSSLPKNTILRFINANDQSCEGLLYKDFPAFSVQFHPEACSGPLDTGFLFDDFISLINNPDFFKNKGWI